MSRRTNNYSFIFDLDRTYSSHRRPNAPNECVNQQIRNDDGKHEEIICYGPISRRGGAYSRHVSDDDQIRSSACKCLLYLSTFPFCLRKKLTDDWWFLSLFIYTMNAPNIFGSQLSHKYLNTTKNFFSSVNQSVASPRLQLTRMTFHTR